MIKTDVTIDFLLKNPQVQLRQISDNRKFNLYNIRGEYLDGLLDGNEKCDSYHYSLFKRADRNTPINLYLNIFEDTPFDKAFIHTSESDALKQVEELTHLKLEKTVIIRYNNHIASEKAKAMLMLDSNISPQYIYYKKVFDVEYWTIEEYFKKHLIPTGEVLIPAPGSSYSSIGNQWDSPLRMLVDFVSKNFTLNDRGKEENYSFEKDILYYRNFNTEDILINHIEQRNICDRFNMYFLYYQQRLDAYLEQQEELTNPSANKTKEDSLLNLFTNFG
jgi:hypothetical protein